jgi:predicted phosphoribosyltransferase
MVRFRDRRDAGRRLAEQLAPHVGDSAIVLALPRGGVPVAYEIARALDLPLDIFVVRKLGVPGREELAAGALASGGVRVVNEDVIAALHIGSEVLDAVTARESIELARREEAYRGDRPRLALRDREVILVDDGMATGASMRAAVQAVRAAAPSRVVVAVPVGAPEAVEAIGRDADDVAVLAMPNWLDGVGQWYDDFEQTSDEEVRELLAEAAQALS